MLILLKQLECFTPEPIGKQDILICHDKIAQIQPKITISAPFLQVIDCEGLYAFPGLMDQHVHILGGGGELGFSSHVKEIDLDEIVDAGVTTLVGLLGADSCMRSLEALYAKGKALEQAGITTYLYSGAYSMPPVTFTGSIVRDLVLIDKVVGIGEIALSDHRSSHAGIEELLSASSDAHLGGLLSGKAGVVHLHMGDGKAGLTPLLQIWAQSDLPIEQFVPTHVNRNRKLFRQAVDFCLSGGNIDLTSGEQDGIPVPEAVRILLNAGCSLSRVTVSSDANGSCPGGGAARIQTLWEDVMRCIKDQRISKEQAFCLVSRNVAQVLKLSATKGSLTEGKDADLLVTDRSLKLKKVYARGALLKEF
jgi:beta-aspartyl-dipeptidase (metallo-type)